MLTVTSEVATTPTVFLNLWKHECNRVIADRFTNQQDKDWFEKTLKQVIEEDFDADTANLMDAEPYFVDFLRDAPEATGMTSVLAIIGYLKPVTRSNPVPLPDLYFDSFSYPVASIVFGDMAIVSLFLLLPRSCLLVWKGAGLLVTRAYK